MLSIPFLWRTPRWRDRSFAAPNTKGEEQGAKRRPNWSQTRFKIKLKVMQTLINKPYKNKSENEEDNQEFSSFSEA